MLFPHELPNEARFFITGIAVVIWVSLVVSIMMVGSAETTDAIGVDMINTTTENGNVSSIYAEVWNTGNESEDVVFFMWTGSSKRLHRWDANGTRTTRVDPGERRLVHLTERPYGNDSINGSISIMLTAVSTDGTERAADPYYPPSIGDTHE